MAERKPPASGEAHIIETYFAPLSRALPGALGLEDDCASIALPPGTDLVVKTDPVREGVHFPPGADPADIAWKALAVNASDLAGKGAAPLAYLLALSFPAEPKPAWLKRFASGLAEAQAAFSIALAGGDTDRAPGPLSIAVTMFGTVPSGRMIRRGAATPGDDVWVTGTLGDAALGLELIGEPTRALRLGLFSNHCDHVIARYDRPQPRLGARALLLDCASAAMDLSDGLLKDADRMARASGVAMTLHRDRLPLSSALRHAVERDPALWRLVVAHGDDYEILFTAPASSRDAIRRHAAILPFAVTAIGTVTNPGSKAAPKSSSKAGPKSSLQSSSKVDPKSSSKADPKSSPKSASKSSPTTSLKSGLQSAPKSDIKTGADKGATVTLLDATGTPLTFPTPGWDHF